MAVAHKDLTGTDLHEIKGASTATVGQVPISDGAGTAPFGKLTHTSLQTTGNPFGAQLLHVREEQSSGVASSTTVPSSSWATIALNTVKTNEIASSSLSSNVVTLPAGTYHFCAISPPLREVTNTGFNAVTKVRLLNSGASTTIFVGPSITNSDRTAKGSVKLEGRFTLSGSTQVAFQYYVVQGAAPTPASTGEVEVYAEMWIWKIA